jgi:hypothetical protein
MIIFKFTIRQMSNHFLNINFITKEHKTDIHSDSDSKNLLRSSLSSLSNNDKISLQMLELDNFPLRGYFRDEDFVIFNLSTQNNVETRRLQRGKNINCFSRQGLLDILNMFKIIPQSSQKKDIVEQIKKLFIEKNYIISNPSPTSSKLTMASPKIMATVTTSVPVFMPKMKVLFNGDVPTKDNLNFCAYYSSPSNDKTKISNELCIINVSKKDFLAGTYCKRRFQRGRPLLNTRQEKLIEMLNVLGIKVELTTNELNQKEKLYLLLEKTLIDWDLICSISR